MKNRQPSAKPKKNPQQTNKDSIIVPPVNSKIYILFFWVILGFSFFMIMKERFFIYPTAINKFLPSLGTVLYNFNLLLRLKGGYAQSLWAYIVFLFLSSGFHWLGRAFLHRLFKFSEGGLYQLGLSKFELIACSWFTGSWLWGMIWFFLGIIGFFRKGVAFALFFACAISFLFYLYTFAKDQNLSEWLSTHLNPKKISPGALILVAWVFSWHALFIYYPFYWDTLMVNMALPYYYAAEGALITNPFNIYSYFNVNTDLLFTWGLLLGSKEAAYLIVWGFFSLFLIFIYGWVKRIASSWAALCAIAVFVASWLAPWLGTYIKNDLQVGIFIILQWWALLFSFTQYRENKMSEKIWVFLSGLFAGIAFGHKFSALPSVFITFIGVPAYFFFNPKEGIDFKQKLQCSLKFLTYYSIGILVSWGPYLIRNFWITGNPVYPFLNGIMGLELLYPWHVRPPSQYTLLDMGWKGFTEYIFNLTRFNPKGPLGGAAIWWRPSAWLCFSAFFCLTKLFTKEVRWISSIAAASWFFSLLFALKPPYHIGPIVFVLCFCFALALHAARSISLSKLLYGSITSVVIVDFIRGVLSVQTKSLVLTSFSILLSGSPFWHFTYNQSGGVPQYASIDEMAFIHHLINKNTPLEDKVLFIGSVRPYGIQRKHYAAFSLDKQPVLYFAELSQDELELKNKLLSLGVRHIVFDPSAWNEWINNSTVDGQHNIPIHQKELTKINNLLMKCVSYRIAVPSGKLVWYSIPKEAEVFPPVPFDADDVYEFPYLYMGLAGVLERNGFRDKALELNNLINQLPLPR